MLILWWPKIFFSQQSSARHRFPDRGLKIINLGLGEICASQKIFGRSRCPPYFARKSFLSDLILVDLRKALSVQLVHTTGARESQY